MRHDTPHRTNHMVIIILTSNRCSRFRQSITRYHINSHRQNKLLYSRRNSRTGSREETPVFNANSLFQQAIDRFLIKFIFHVQYRRRSQPFVHIFQIMFTPHFNSIQHQLLFQSGCLIDFFLHAGIHFLPETGNTAHSRRTDLLYCLLDISRTQVDRQSTPHRKTPASPCTLKHMSKRKEIHNYILITQLRETFIVCRNGRLIARMMQHHPLAVSGCSTGIKNIGKITITRL